MADPFGITPAEIAGLQRETDRSIDVLLSVMDAESPAIQLSKLDWNIEQLNKRVEARNLHLLAALTPNEINLLRGLANLAVPLVTINIWRRMKRHNAKE